MFQNETCQWSTPSQRAASRTVEGVALVPTQLRSRLTDFAVALSSADATSLEQHTIKGIGDSVPNERVRRCPSENAGLVVCRVGNPSTCPRNGASMQCAIVERERADDDIVLSFIVHFIPVLDVDSSSSHIVQDIGFDRRGMGRVDDDASLVASLDGIVLEQARGTIIKFVKVEAVLS